MLQLGKFFIDAGMRERLNHHLFLQNGYAVICTCVMLSLG
jgi:hypothetical protein